MSPLIITPEIFLSIIRHFHCNLVLSAVNLLYTFICVKFFYLNKLTKEVINIHYISICTQQIPKVLVILPELLIRDSHVIFERSLHKSTVSSFFSEL